jgi:hypothetical protein
MKKINVPGVLLAASVFWFLIACSENKGTTPELVTADRSMDSLGFNDVLKDVTKQFIAEMRQYKRGGINIVGYLQIMEASENKTFKIRYDGVYRKDFFRLMHVDDYFFEDGIWFCVNYNVSSLMKAPHKNYKKSILEKSGIKNFRPADTRYPSWLVKITDGKVERINKRAFSGFGNESFSVLYPEDGGWKEYDVTEWGEYF